jgi:uncharacterized protein
MTIRTAPWPTGVPCWADLTTPDPEAAAAFYGSVLGWTASPDRREVTVEGHPVAGLVPRSDGEGATWTLCVATDDLAATLARVTDAGGTVLRNGERTVVADPTGAVVGLRQGGGAQWVNAPGGLNWEDLRSADPAVSQRFYADVFGWTFEPLFEGYGTVANPDAPHPVGGIGPLWGSAPGWLVYFGVVDVDVAVAAALEAGGTVVAPAHDSEYGRMAQLADPHGAGFAVFTPPAGAPQPAR